MQLAAVPEHAEQFELHGTQVEPDTNQPAVKQLVQVLPVVEFMKLPAGQVKQLLADPVQAKQLLLQS